MFSGLERVGVQDKKGKQGLEAVCIYGRYRSFIAGNAQRSQQFDPNGRHCYRLLASYLFRLCPLTHWIHHFPKRNGARAEINTFKSLVHDYFG